FNLEALERRELPATGLVAAYNFNEGAGTVLHDLSGNGNNGVIAEATWSSAGKYGRALSFNGSGAVVTVKDAPSLRLTTGMTLEAWVKPSQVDNSWRDVIYKGDDNYYLEASSTSGRRPAIGAVQGASHPEAFGPSALARRTWVHLAATYDGAALRLFVNGTQV